MADFVVNFVVERLSQLLVEEADSFGGVEDRVKSLHGELRQINIFLKNYEGKRSGHEMVEDKSKGKRSLLEKLGYLITKSVDVAYEAEDVIDTIIFNVATQMERPEKIANDTDVQVLYDVAKKIEGLNEEINKIYDKIEIYGIERAEASVHEPTEELHRCWREVEEDDVVGFDDPCTTLVKQLTEGNPQLDDISILGKSGSGKTTLARKIYNNVDIKSQFNFRAWVNIRSLAPFETVDDAEFDGGEVSLEILKSEMRKSDELTRKKLFKYLSEDELKKKLFTCLQGKRYLVVMDDICKTEIWDAVRSAFPDDRNGSRILFTNIGEVATNPYRRILFTNIGEVATNPYLLAVLNEDESWKLLSKKVFRGGTCPLQLETLGRQIAKSCRGLPFSIVALAGILANKEKKYETWAKFIGPVYRSSFDILTLCYLHLPRRLKPCLLYLVAFPVGFEIPVRLLINLWVAEGFMQHSRNRGPEDVAEDYLEELIDRGLVEVASRRTDGGAKTCRIHYLVQLLCIERSVEDKFLQVLISSSDSITHRRASLQSPINSYIHIYTRCVRSLLFFNQDTYHIAQKQWKWVYENFKLGRVLNFGHVNLFSIPTEITKLIHLKYLGIECDALKAIPASIGNLVNLETLNMGGTSLNCLPKGIWKLRHLRNLYMSGPVSLPNDLDPDVEALWNLQVLSTVSLKPQSSLMIPNVKKLGLWFASDESNNEVVNVLKSLHHLHRLQTLKFINYSEYHCLPMLLPSTLIKITLRQVRLKVRRDMRVLGKLPNLQILKLQSCLLSSKFHVFANCSEDPQFSFPPPSFPQLKVLKLENLGIKNWKQCRGAMPCLKHLVIKRCSELTMLPLNRLSLTALQDVKVLWSNSESAKMIQKLQMKVGFKLLIYPPSTDDLHEKTAT